MVAVSARAKRNIGPGFSTFQVVLLLVCVLALERVLKPWEPRGQPAAKAAAEWPIGGVEWDTGEKAIIRAENKTPLRSGETMSNHPQPLISNNKTAAFKESALFHKVLDGLHGIEIGSSAHNGFGLNTLNVDFTSDVTKSTQRQIIHTGVYRRVDIIAHGNRLPFPSSSLDFVLSSHAVEHFHDPIGFLCEAARVIRPGGYIASILTLHGAQKTDKTRNRTLLSDLVLRHYHPIAPALDDHRHWQVWMVEDMIEMYRYMNLKVVAWQDKDDKVGNGFSVIVMVPENKFEINC